MPRMSILAVMVSAGLGCTIAVAETHTVCAVGCDYTSINQAIDAATDGDLIQLAAEVYLEGVEIDTDGKAVVIRGTVDAAGEPTTILSGIMDHRVIACRSGEGFATRFENLVVQLGDAVFDGGGLLVVDSDPTVSNCRFEFCTAVLGGGVHVQNGSPTFVGTNFKNCVAFSHGGAMMIQGGDVTIDDCGFMFNSAEDSGGAIRAVSSSLDIRQSDFDFNIARDDGGGIHATACLMDALDCDFRENNGDRGGGILTDDGSEATMVGCLFDGNVSGTMAGALMIDGSVVALEGCDFDHNMGVESGGAVLVRNGILNAQQCRFEENWAESGGGLAISLDSLVTLVDSFVTDNESSDAGGGIHVGGSVLTLIRDFICSNRTAGLSTDENQVSGDLVDVGSTQTCISGDCDRCDYDGDGIDNGTEEDSGTDPNDADTDDDGVPDGEDAFPSDPTENADSDGDGVGDNRDRCPFDPLDECDPGDVPDPNPAPNPDGSKTYWCGNDMQWEIQEAIDDASPGDIIVIRAGVYVDSPVINKPNLTIRPFVTFDGVWEDVVFWNPTKGPQAQNGWAMFIGSDTENTYVGRPRRFRELPSGFVSRTMVVPGEYDANPGSPAIEVGQVGGECFTFWSRSIDNTGVMSENGKATIENCVFTSQNGFGGGAMLVGDANDTTFVQCIFEDLFANGTTLRTDVPGLDLPNYCISIHATTGGIMEYTFSECLIEDNRGETIIYQQGGRGSWADCDIRNNDSELNFSGVLTLYYCNPIFSNTRFTDNLSGYGTVYYDATGVSSVDGLRFTECRFLGNDTIDGQWGGVIWAQDDDSQDGGPPKVMFDGCQIDGNNGNLETDQQDFVTPWFPTYRQGDANQPDLDGSNDGDVDCPPNADLNGDGIVDGVDLGLMFSFWGTDGVP